MKLRRLNMNDAFFMLEWMHDPFVVDKMDTDFASKTIKDCEQFIKNAQDSQRNLHLAISTDDDDYMGTVSLKNINLNSLSAEFAIAVRRSAMGKGYSQFAMNKIIEIGFKYLGLEQIYWYVSPENVRAIRFYQKNGYNQVPIYKLNYYIKDSSSSDIDKYIWYLIKKD